MHIRTTNLTTLHDQQMLLTAIRTRINAAK